MLVPYWVTYVKPEYYANLLVSTKHDWRGTEFLSEDFLPALEKVMTAHNVDVFSHKRCRAAMCCVLLGDADPRGQLGRGIDVDARAEGLHRVHQRASVGAAATKELVASLEPFRLLQPRQREVSSHVAIALPYHESSRSRPLSLTEAGAKEIRLAMRQAGVDSHRR